MFPALLAFGPLACGAAATDDEATSSPELTTRVASGYCSLPALGGHFLFADDCHAPEGPRLVRMDLTSGQVTTVAKERPIELRVIGDRVVYLENRDDGFVVHSRAVGDPSDDLAATFSGASPDAWRFRHRWDFSPDGKAFVGWRPVGEDEASGELLVGRLDGSGATKVHPIPPVGASRFVDFHAFWSSDGSRVVLEMHHSGGAFPTGAYVLRLGPDPELRPLNSWPIAGWPVVPISGPGGKATFDGTELFVSYLSRTADFPALGSNRSAAARIDVEADTREELVSAVRSSQFALAKDKLYFEKPLAGAPWEPHGRAEAIASFELSSKQEKTVIALDATRRAPLMSLTRDGSKLMFRAAGVPVDGMRIGLVDTATDAVTEMGIVRSALPRGDLDLLIVEDDDRSVQFRDLAGNVEDTGVEAALGWYESLKRDPSTKNALIVRSPDSFVAYEHLSGTRLPIDVGERVVMTEPVDGGSKWVVVRNAEPDERKEPSYEVHVAGF